MEVEIRQAAAEDFPAIYELTAKAFRQEFESKLIEKIQHGKNYVKELSLVAVHREKILGYILFSHISILGKQQKFETLALAPLAVDPDYQHQGIGKQLVRRGLETAKSLGFDSVIVMGHSHYYPEFGFKRASLWHIHCPFTVPDDAFMAIELVHGALEGKEGTVNYPLEFTEM